MTKLAFEIDLARTHKALDSVLVLFLMDASPDYNAVDEAIEYLQRNHRQYGFPITLALDEEHWEETKAAALERSRRPR